MSVNLGTRDKHVSDQLTGWTNTDFNTFVSSGKNITSAIESAGTSGHCISNAIHVHGNSDNYGRVIFEMFVTVNSGETPQAILYLNGVAQSWQTLTPGSWDKCGWTIEGDSSDYAVGFENYSQGATDFSALCRLYCINGY